MGIKMSQLIIVVTGCSKIDGAGFQLSKELLKRGHRVIATVRDKSKINWSTEDLLNAENLDLRLLDLMKQGSIIDFSQQVLKDYGYIDVLVNNAAQVMIGPVETASISDLQTTYQTKVFGPVMLIQQFLPCMRERKSGLLTTTSSIFCADDFGLPGIGVYFSALDAFEKIQDALAIELLPWNIDVINYRPGPIGTSLSRSEGERTDVNEACYSGFLEKAYQWFHEHTEYQSAEVVAGPYADLIEGDRAQYRVQSGQFGSDYVSQFGEKVGELPKSYVKWKQHLGW